MHEAALSQAALPEPVVVLGMLLRPFSLGHYVWLEREQFQTNHQPSSIAASAALPMAVLICCHTWEENQLMRSDRWLNLKLWLWKRRLRHSSHPSHPSHELEKFQRYIAAGTLEFPISEVVKPDRSTPRLPGTPFVLRLQQWLMLTFKLSESAAWDYPMGLAKMRWAAHWEQEGGLDVYNAHDAEFDQFVADQEAKGAAQLARNGGFPAAVPADVTTPNSATEKSPLQ